MLNEKKLKLGGILYKTQKVVHKNNRTRSFMQHCAIFATINRERMSYCIK